MTDYDPLQFFLSDEEVDDLLSEVVVARRKPAALPSKSVRYDRLYMDIAVRCSEMSYGVRAKVGAVIVKDGNTVSMGWNGMPSGMTNECESKVFSTSVTQEVTEDLREEFPFVDTIAPGNYRRYKLVTKPEVLHAEQNAICKAARSGTALAGAAIYVTLAPCMNCATMIYNSGINRVVYGTDYAKSGLAFLRDRGVEVDKLTSGGLF